MLELYRDTNESEEGFRAPQEYLIIRGTKAG